MEGSALSRRIIGENSKMDPKSQGMVESVNDWWIDEEEEELDDLITEMQKRKRMVNQKRSSR